jgi:hypothetical protein
MDLERIDENRWRDVADVVEVVDRAASRGGSRSSGRWW